MFTRSPTHAYATIVWGFQHKCCFKLILLPASMKPSKELGFSWPNQILLNKKFLNCLVCARGDSSTLNSPDCIATRGGANLVNSEAIDYELLSSPPGLSSGLPVGCPGMPPSMMYTGPDSVPPRLVSSATLTLHPYSGPKFASWPAVCGRQFGWAAGPSWVGSHPFKHLSWCCGEIVGTGPP